MISPQEPHSRPLSELEPETTAEAEAPAPHFIPLEATRSLAIEHELLDPLARPRSSWPLRLLLAGGGLLATSLLALAVEDLLTRALAAESYLAGIGLAGLLLFLFGLLLGFVREWRGLASLDQLREARQKAEVAEKAEQPAAIEAVVDDLCRLYRGRSDMEWSLRRFGELRPTAESFGGLLPLAEKELLRPLDERARAIAVTAVRRAAMITAISPFALLDMAVSLAIGLRLLRRIARIYGGRPGWLGAWRLLRLSLTQVLASGALDLADDSLGDLIGAGVASRLSRRAGVGLLNGLLTARIAAAAIDLCRPFPWSDKPPSARGLLRRALTDLF